MRETVKTNRVQIRMGLEYAQKLDFNTIPHAVFSYPPIALNLHNVLNLNVGFHHYPSSSQI